MQLVDEHGGTLDAEYTVEPDGSYLALIMTSRSGMSGSRPPRNPDYSQALTMLLERLSQLDAVLVDALVDSRRTQQLGLPESDRSLIAAPIRLAQVPDMESLRRGMGTEQAKIARRHARWHSSSTSSLKSPERKRATGNRGASEYRSSVADSAIVPRP